ncbi:MAG: hypothetical protein FJ276_12285 [Planctomycetes bacterium]|nr:hypothetical protein [Planctomycetota bacterium]
MDASEKILVLVLRISGVILLTALVPVVMPQVWMDAIHRGLGMGPLPEGPIVGYLTRSLSALYAYHGALVLFISLDVRRYLSLVKCFAVLGIAFAVILFVLDFMVGMPPWWTIAEGSSIAMLSCALLWLAGRVPRDPAPTSSSPGKR